MNINDLNTECLLKIFSYLPYSDLLKVEKVCEKWLDLAETCWWNVRTLDSDEQRMSDCGKSPMTTHVVKKIIKRAQKRLLEIRLKSYPYDYIIKSNIQQTIAHWCPFLQVLKLSTITCTEKGMEILAKKCRLLKVIELSSIVRLMDKDLYHLFKNNADLESITLKWSTTLKGECFNGCTSKLKELNLYGCINLSARILLDLFTKLFSIDTLIFDYCIPFTGRFLSDLSDIFPNLKSFSLNSYSFPMPIYSLQNITRMKNLKTLSLNSNNLLSDRLMEVICENCVELECLDISRVVASNIYLSERALENIVKLNKLTKLRMNYLRLLSNSILIALGNKGILEDLEIQNCINVTDAGAKMIISGCLKLQVKIYFKIKIVKFIVKL